MKKEKDIFIIKGSYKEDGDIFTGASPMGGALAQGTPVQGAPVEI